MGYIFKWGISICNFKSLHVMHRSKAIGVISCATEGPAAFRKDKPKAICLSIESVKEAIYIFATKYCPDRFILNTG